MQMPEPDATGCNFRFGSKAALRSSKWCFRLSPRSGYHRANREVQGGPIAAAPVKVHQATAVRAGDLAFAPFSFASFCNLARSASLCGSFKAKNWVSVSSGKKCAACPKPDLRNSSCGPQEQRCRAGLRVQHDRLPRLLKRSGYSRRRLNRLSTVAALAFSEEGGNGHRPSGTACPDKM
jgi:hypothetical protein